MNWKAFVLAHGFGASDADLAYIVGRDVSEIRRVKQGPAGLLPRSRTRASYPELFAIFRGRPPSDDEWPRLIKSPRGQYPWRAPELALLATLVGRLGIEEITAALSERLKRLTGDPSAERSRASVQNKITNLGLQSTDVLGGLTASQAAKEIGSYATIIAAIRAGKLKAVRTGRLWVIPTKAWETWKQGRVLPPAGYIPLARLRVRLGIKSDSKLPEFASSGYIPTAIRCTPQNAREANSTKNGTWYVDPAVAKKLLDDRRAGRPMPWHGKPLAVNLSKTWALWEARKHPASCETCRQIWGGDPPANLDEYTDRYPPLAFGAKRHLTKRWSAGITVSQVARTCGKSREHVQRAIASGQLNPEKHGRTLFVSQTDATRWRARGCPTGIRSTSWISLSTAATRHGFTKLDLKQFIAQGRLPTTIITAGPARGETFVSRHACARLREEIGYTEREAARKIGVTVWHARQLLKDIDWRGTGRIPLATVQAAIKRVSSGCVGITIREAAEALEKPIGWVEAHIKAGTVRVARVLPGTRLRRLTAPMVRRLAKVKRRKPPRKPLSAEWLTLSQGADLAGVTKSTIWKWHTVGEIRTIYSENFIRYSKKSIKARARVYWRTVRFKRKVLPKWLEEESRAKLLPGR